ncbi:MAG: hypothetical protein IJ991_14935, partial [Thermoguttaceae bacterium]|nr:hypothetical protein [Thermoguttaceae bacterium]
VAASAFLFGGAGELSATPSRRSAEVAVETVEVLEVVEVGGGDEGDVATEEEKRWNAATRKRNAPWLSPTDDSAAFLPPRPIRASARSSERFDEPISSDAVRAVAEAIFWTLVVALVAALVGALVWAALGTLRNGGAKEKKKKDEKADRERRLEAIAPEARERVDDLGTAAENALAVGDLRLALVYFFSWLIVESDKRGLLWARRGKTNREYWIELAVNPEVQTIYKATMNEFERVYFGAQTISRAEFDDVWRLREPFVAITRRLDAEREAQERAARANEARNAAHWENLENPEDLAHSVNLANGGGGAVSRIWALPLAAAFALSAVASSGCGPRTEYWNEGWSDEYAATSGGNESIDGVSIFADYCAEKTRRVDRKNGTTVDAERYETIVWFYPAKGVAFWRGKGGTSASASTSEGEGAPFAAALNVAQDDWDDPFADDSWGEEEKDPFADLADYRERLKTSLREEEKDPFADDSFWESGDKNGAEGTETASPRRVAFADLAFAEARPEIERWLREKPNRTFVFVPDGWRADADYWREIQGKAPSEHAAWAAAELKSAEKARRQPNVWTPDLPPWEEERAENAEKARRSDDGFWAAWDVLDEGKRRERLSGVDAWTAGLPATFEVWTSRTLTPDVENGTEVLLSVDGDPFVCRRRVGESDFFALESAAFLLNFALTKPENRVLAGRLVDEFDSNGRTLFWFGGQLVFSTVEKKEEPVSPFSLARLTPFSLAVLHLAALAALFVAWRFPILGRPKRNAKEATNDYAKHVDGVAFLLEKADARSWAWRELETFRAAREAGAAFREPSVDGEIDGGEQGETEKGADERTSATEGRGKNVERSGRGASRKFFRR